MNMRIITIFLFFLFSYIGIFAQQTSVVDFKNLTANLDFSPEIKRIEGEVSYQFKILENADSIYLDGRNMTLKTSSKSKLKAELKATPKKIWIYYNFKAGKTYQLDFSYQVDDPKHALYFVNTKDSNRAQIWSQGQGKENSHWIPSIDDPNDKIVFDITYKIPKDFRAIGNGKLIEHKKGKEKDSWHYKMTNPMSSYLLGIAIGKFDYKKIHSNSDIPIELYFHPEDIRYFEPTYRYTKKIFNFLEEEIGFPYPWENYKQIPVRDFLYAGMENTTTTIFAETLLTDSIAFIDQNYVSTNAHEMAHQWFGDLVTAKSDADHWLQEGFASYYALLAERKIFGDDEFYFKLFEKAETLKSESDKGKGEAINRSGASSLTYYDKGAWALFVLHEKLGDADFKKGIKNYLQKYQFQNVEIQDFIQEMESASGKDLSEYVENWLKQSAFQADEALELLKKSTFIKEYMSLVALRKKDFEHKKEHFQTLFNFPINSYLAAEGIQQLSGNPLGKEQIQLLKKAFASNDIPTRQAIAFSLEKIPNELKSEFESLLKDDSYLTKEVALTKLWSQFPENRSEYLNSLQNEHGFYNKNIRTLWLVLSLATPDYLPKKKSELYKELSAYTSDFYDYSIRQNAFAHLYQINVFTEENYKDLMQSCLHPVWRFRTFSRELLEELLKEENHKDAFIHLKTEFSEKEQELLSKYLEE